jgi:hypothetical protein
MPHRYKCSSCDKWHEGFPDLGYEQPQYALDVPEADRETRVFLTSDRCVVDDEFFFVRCLLPFPVLGTDDEFSWGVWCSLSRANFMRYQDEREAVVAEGKPMFGYLSNSLPHYPATLNLTLSVKPRGDGLRPIAVLDETDHPLAVEQRDGISLEKLLEIVGPFLAH